MCASPNIRLCSTQTLPTMAAIIMFLAAPETHTVCVCVFTVLDDSSLKLLLGTLGERVSS